MGFFGKPIKSGIAIKVADFVIREARKPENQRNMPTAKGRIRVLDHHAVDHPDTGQAFVSVVLAILPGPTAEERQRTSAALTKAVDGAVPLPPGTKVRTEVREMDPQGYTSHDG